MLENTIIKFQDFPGFPGPIRTLDYGFVADWFCIIIRGLFNLTSKFGNFVIVSLLLMYPILNKIGFNQKRGNKYTYVRLKYALCVSLRVEHSSSVIHTCS